jgi:hypothetical protein
MLLNCLYEKNKQNALENGVFIAKRVSQEIELAAREKLFSLKLNLHFISFQ